VSRGAHNDLQLSGVPSETFHFDLSSDVPLTLVNCIEKKWYKRRPTLMN